jgi:hypothetical protein
MHSGRRVSLRATWPGEGAVRWVGSPHQAAGAKGAVPAGQHIAPAPVPAFCKHTHCHLPPLLTMQHTRGVPVAVVQSEHALFQWLCTMQRPSCSPTSLAPAAACRSPLLPCRVAPLTTCIPHLLPLLTLASCKPVPPPPSSSTPPLCPTLSSGHTIRAVAAGRYSSYALDSTGRVWAWGYEACATAGTLPPAADAWKPRRVGGQLAGQRVTAFSAGGWGQEGGGMCCPCADKSPTPCGRMYVGGAVCAIPLADCKLAGGDRLAPRPVQQHLFDSVPFIMLPDPFLPPPRSPNKHTPTLLACLPLLPPPHQVTPSGWLPRPQAPPTPAPTGMMAMPAPCPAALAPMPRGSWGGAGPPPSRAAWSYPRGRAWWGWPQGGSMGWRSPLAAGCGAGEGAQRQQGGAGTCGGRRWWRGGWRGKQWWRWRQGR